MLWLPIMELMKYTVGIRSEGYSLNAVYPIIGLQI